MSSFSETKTKHQKISLSLSELLSLLFLISIVLVAVGVCVLKNRSASRLAPFFTVLSCTNYINEPIHELAPTWNVVQRTWPTLKSGLSTHAPSFLNVNSSLCVISKSMRIDGQVVLCGSANEGKVRGRPISAQLPSTARCGACYTMHVLHLTFEDMYGQC